MALTSSNTRPDPAAAAEAQDQLSDISRRLSRDLAGLNTHRRFGRAASSNIRRCLTQLREMLHVPTTAIRKSQVTMALLDIAESPVVDDTLRQEARTIRDSFSQTLLADSLVHWSPDKPAAVIVLLPISDHRAFPSDDRDAQPPFFLLRFDFDSDVSTLALNQHALQTTAAAPLPFAVSARRISHPANASTLKAADLWSLSSTTTTTTAAADRRDVYTVAVRPTLSPPANTTTTTPDPAAFSLTFDITAAAPQPATAASISSCSSLLRHTRLLLPARLFPGDCLVTSRPPPPPVMRLDDDPAQLVVQVSVPERGRRMGEVRLVERRTVWGEGSPDAGDAKAALLLAGRGCEGMGGLVDVVVVVLVVVVVAAWGRVRRGRRRRSCGVEGKRLLLGGEKGGWV